MKITSIHIFVIVILGCASYLNYQLDREIKKTQRLQIEKTELEMAVHTCADANIENMTTIGKLLNERSDNIAAIQRLNSANAQSRNSIQRIRDEISNQEDGTIAPVLKTAIQKIQEGRQE